MKRHLKAILWILVLCAACLLAGKYLRIFTNRADKDKADKQSQNENSQKQPDEGIQKTTEPSILLPEQQEALAGFYADGIGIVLDAGHGGFDPGKVGVNGAKEKEINLKVAQILKQYLEAAGFTVDMTRTTDDGLYSENDTNKKAADMKKRVSIMEEKQPAFAISIHQNSFTQESSFGAQVFYYTTSEEGKHLAEVLQKTIREAVANGNYREAKANDSYYLLKKSPCPLVIVECGFLSNPSEAALLVTEDYQKSMAWAICLGVVEYCREEGKEVPSN